MLNSCIGFPLSVFTSSLDSRMVASCLALFPSYIFSDVSRSLSLWSLKGKASKICKTDMSERGCGFNERAPWVVCAEAIKDYFRVRVLKRRLSSNIIRHVRSCFRHLKTLHILHSALPVLWFSLAELLQTLSDVTLACSGISHITFSLNSFLTWNLESGAKHWVYHFSRIISFSGMASCCSSLKTQIISAVH